MELYGSLLKSSNLSIITNILLKPELRNNLYSMFKVLLCSVCPFTQPYIETITIFATFDKIIGMLTIFFLFLDSSFRLFEKVILEKLT